MKRFFLLSMLIVSTLSYSQTLELAIAKTENERYRDAIKDFQKLIAGDPINGENYFYFGDCYFEMDELDSAKMMWRKGYEVDKLRALPLVGYGRVLWLDGKDADAQAEFSEALLKTKKNKLKKAEVIRGIAEIYIKAPNKNLSGALTLLEEAIAKLDKTNEDNYLLKGDALYAQNSSDASEALKAYNQALLINPTSPRGIVRKALIYQRAKNEPEANKMYNQAKQIDPTYAPAYRLNAELYMMFGKNEKAIENWEEYLKLNNNIESRYRYTNALFAAKVYPTLLEQLEVLKSNGFVNFYTERMYAFALAESNDSTDLVNALAASDRFFAIVPEDKINYQDYKVRGLIYEKQGLDSLTVIEFEKAVNMNETAYNDLSSQLIRMYVKAKNYQKVVDAYDYRRDKNQKLSAAEEYDLGKAYYFGLKNYKVADSLFQIVIDNDSTYVPAYIYRARCNYKLDTINGEINGNWWAFPYYSKVTQLINPEDRQQPSKKSFILEALRYCADYYSKSDQKNLAIAKQYFEQILEVEPNDPVAKKLLGIE